MTTSSSFAASISDLPIHPGEFLAEELEARGLTQKELARRMNRSPQVINQIVRGKKAITAETAIAPEQAMPGLSARYWLNLQTDYELAAAYQRMAG
ncbi:MAG: HigA family addiction module antitoxin [Dehalococcoidia bacterium]|nr:HigA family addiction module antitoxin [Dehalococcoidia bacterium]